MLTNFISAIGTVGDGVYVSVYARVAVAVAVGDDAGVGVNERVILGCAFVGVFDGGRVRVIVLEGGAR